MGGNFTAITPTSIAFALFNMRAETVTTTGTTTLSQIVVIED
jgi:hypothetical protein